MIVPLDGSELAEFVLPAVVELGKVLNLKVLLIRVFDIPATLYGGSEGRYAINYDAIRKQFRFEAHTYLEKTAEELRQLGLDKVSLVCPEGTAQMRFYFWVNRSLTASLRCVPMVGRVCRGGYWEV